jgi:hypothetical protein
MTLYRYVDHHYAREEDDWPQFIPDIRIHLDTHTVIKETPKGYWIGGSWMHMRWVSKTSKKRFAHADKDEAWESFKRRKARQVGIYRTRLRCAEFALQMERPKDPWRG